jgi:hypothetical protein
LCIFTALALKFTNTYVETTAGNRTPYVFVEQSSTIELYCQPPPPNLEMIASKQACFIKQTNIFIERKMIQATT